MDYRKEVLVKLPENFATLRHSEQQEAIYQAVIEAYYTRLLPRPSVTITDEGIGQYEYWGSLGFDQQLTATLDDNNETRVFSFMFSETKYNLRKIRRFFEYIHNAGLALKEDFSGAFFYVEDYSWPIEIHLEVITELRLSSESTLHVIHVELKWTENT